VATTEADTLSRRPFRSISSTVIRRTIAGAIVCAVVAATLQALVALREERSAFERALRNIAETNVPLLSVALWDIEPKTIRTQLAQIASQPEIAYVRLTERTGHTFEAGDRRRVSEEGPTRLAIPYPEGRDGTIGEIEVTANKATLYEHVAQRVAIVVFGYAVLAAVLCALIAAVLRLELQRPMRVLTRFTSELTPDRLTTPLELSRPDRRWHDELDQLAVGFRTLQDGIHRHVENLDALVRERTSQLEGALDEIRALTITDALTGCFNRRYLDERMREEVARSQRSGHPLSVIIADIDHFKRINDTYGHAGGDEVLRGTARILREEMRDRVDWVARLGGEEFVILLPEATLDAARAVAERMRLALQDAVFEHAGERIRITSSFGVATLAAQDTAESVLARADQMLYRAKESNRNVVVVG
jgi:diguanylate cyclase (GGDEF)-like protein